MNTVSLAALSMVAHTHSTIITTTVCMAQFAVSRCRLLMLQILDLLDS